MSDADVTCRTDRPGEAVVVTEHGQPVVRGAAAIYVVLVERFAVHADVALLSFDHRQREAVARAVEDVLLIPDELPAT